MEFGDFDDDFFDSSQKPRKTEQDFSDEIKNYQPKIVTSKVVAFFECVILVKSQKVKLEIYFFWKKFLSETYAELEDIANLYKTKADFSYFNKNYADSLELYKKSMG
jgi:hypothetical protein